MKRTVPLVLLLLCIIGAIGFWRANHHIAVKFASLGDPIPNGEYRSWIFVDSDFTSNEHRKRVAFRWSGGSSLEYLLAHDAQWECQQRGAQVECEAPKVLRLCTPGELAAAQKSQQEAHQREVSDKAKGVFVNPFDEKYWGTEVKDCWAPRQSSPGQ